MNVRVIARDSKAFIGRKCPVCQHIARPGQTVVCDKRWVAHRTCVMRFLVASYESLPVDGEPAKRSTREQRDREQAIKREQRFAEYRAGLLDRYDIEENSVCD